MGVRPLGRREAIEGPGSVFPSLRYDSMISLLLCACVWTLSAPCPLLPPAGRGEQDAARAQHPSWRGNDSCCFKPNCCMGIR